FTAQPLFLFMLPFLPHEEGYVKYRYYHTQAAAPAAELLTELNEVRSRLWQLGLVGMYANGIGYGNVSLRTTTPSRFIISATQTGHLPHLEPAHYTLIERYNILQNKVWGMGQLPASSEALTHAALYQVDAQCLSVLHIHQASLWKKWLYVLPTTYYYIPYGTPQMAMEIQRLYNQTQLPQLQVLVMAGHTDGLIAYGNSPTQALNCLLNIMDKT
ncbi:MAG TPA: class II aldolase/adducin family protein, partial [Chitinophagales bacterium]|nr:class II aldolase/adducin family protein [Chitinophagales bacterium]